MSKLLILLVSLLSSFFCKSGEPAIEDTGLAHIAFIESEAIFANPERGFYNHFPNFMSAKDAPMTVNAIKADRIQGVTLYYTGYYLSDFMD